MPERRPNLKKPGITATGRQWQTINALRSDGWFVLEADPSLWPDEDADAVAQALADRAAVLVEAERVFLDASIAVWREVDRLTRDVGAYPGIPMTSELRLRERAAWERYRCLLDAPDSGSHLPQSEAEG